jgi:hypothetical protein
MIAKNESYIHKRRPVMAIQQLQKSDVYDGKPALSISANDRGTSSVTTPKTRIIRTAIGVLALVLGAWGGLVPYIGHALNFNADGSSLWAWNLQHGLLYLAPGIAAFVGGGALVLSAWVPKVRGFDISRAMLPFGALLLGSSGIWFILGPSVWPVYYASHVFVAATPVRGFSELLVYNLGEGVILSMLAGIAGTWAVRALFSREQ